MALQKKKRIDLTKSHRPYGSPSWRKWIAQVIECQETGDYSPLGDCYSLSVNDIVFMINYQDGRLTLDDVINRDNRLYEQDRDQ